MLRLPNIEQYFYSFTSGSIHIQDIEKEFRDLNAFLARHSVCVKSAIDVGCGDGAVTAKIQKLLQIDQIHGVEINPRLVGSARARGLQVVLADILSLEVSGNFDVALSYGALHHFSNATTLLSALKRLSRRYVLIVDSTVREILLHRFTGSPRFPLEASPYRIRTVQEIASAMEAAGCRVHGVYTNENANIWHDRSFILGERLDAAVRDDDAPPHLSASI